LRATPFRFLLLVIGVVVVLVVAVTPAFAALNVNARVAAAK